MPGEPGATRAAWARWSLLVAAGGAALVVVVGFGVAAMAHGSAHGSSGTDTSAAATGAPATPLSTRRPAASDRPGLVYVVSKTATDRPRLQGAWIGGGSTITLTNDTRVQSVAFFVDEPPGQRAAAPFAIDRKAPFTLPRRGKNGTPYGIGPHVVRTDVMLQSGRHMGLKVAYTVARMLQVPATVDADTLVRMITAVPPGALLVQPAAGETSFTVTGEVFLDRGLVTIEHAHMSDGIEFQPNASGSRLVASSALGFDIFGADDVAILGNTFDGRGVDSQNSIWDKPAGNTPDGWRIIGNTFQNFYIDDGSTHSEALFIGYSTHGLIERNTFTNNGNTAHIFFSWWGGIANPSISYPRDICVRGNTFNQTHNATSDINFRDEIPPTAGIVIQRDAANTKERFYGVC